MKTQKKISTGGGCVFGKHRVHNMYPVYMLEEDNTIDYSTLVEPFVSQREVESSVDKIVLLSSQEAARLANDQIATLKTTSQTPIKKLDTAVENEMIKKVKDKADQLANNYDLIHEHDLLIETIAMIISRYNLDKSNINKLLCLLKKTVFKYETLIAEKQAMNALTANENHKENEKLPIYNLPDACCRKIKLLYGIMGGDIKEFDQTCKLFKEINTVNLSPKNASELEGDLTTSIRSFLDAKKALFENLRRCNWMCVELTVILTFKIGTRTEIFAFPIVIHFTLKPGVQPQGDYNKHDENYKYNIHYGNTYDALSFGIQKKPGTQPLTLQFFDEKKSNMHDRKDLSSFFDDEINWRAPAAKWIAFEISRIINATKTKFAYSEINDKITNLVKLANNLTGNVTEVDTTNTDESLTYIKNCIKQLSLSHECNKNPEGLINLEHKYMNVCFIASQEAFTTKFLVDIFDYDLIVDAPQGCALNRDQARGIINAANRNLQGKLIGQTKIIQKTHPNLRFPISKWFSKVFNRLDWAAVTKTHGHAQPGHIYQQDVVPIVYHFRVKFDGPCPITQHGGKKRKPCKNCPRGVTKYYNGTEKTPLGRGYVAAFEKEGARKKGLDGKTYAVAVARNGAKRWASIKKR